MSLKLKNKHRLHDQDTGSVALQIISLNEQIQKGEVHGAKNKKDIPFKRSLHKKIAKQKRFLSYLKKRDPLKHQELNKELSMNFNEE
jgi:ribosomal protein S15